MIRKSLFLFIFIQFFLIIGCKDDMDSMIEDYNEGFVSETKEVAYTVDNVVAEDILATDYPMPYRTTLCLTAPIGGANYSWDVVIGENKCNIEEGTAYNLSHVRTLELYVPNSVLKQWAHYELTLTVQKVDGSYIKDTAKLYIY